MSGEERPEHIHRDRTGQVAVVFVSRRRDADHSGYAMAATAMERLAAAQPGFRGLDDARNDDGIGITVSWWVNEAAAIAWRAQSAHASIREQGRASWYDTYELAVATVTRSYAWQRG